MYRWHQCPCPAACFTSLPPTGGPLSTSALKAMAASLLARLTRPRGASSRHCCPHVLPHSSPCVLPYQTCCSSRGDASAVYVAGAGGTSSFDLQQRFKVAKGLALEVRGGGMGRSGLLLLLLLALMVIHSHENSAAQSTAESAACW